MISTGESLVFQGIMRGHKGWVTAIACPKERPDMILSGSRDKSIILWKTGLSREEGKLYTRKRLTGHTLCVQDVAISPHGQFALSASWDGTLRLWDLNLMKTKRKFLGHVDRVLSVALSEDGRIILSGSRDKTIKVWNTLGDCKHTIQDQDYMLDGGVSCLRISPKVSPNSHLFVSGGGDKVVNVRHVNTCNIHASLTGHTGCINTVTVSLDGSVCASGGEDGDVLIWDIAKGQLVYLVKTDESIHALCFCPNRHWLCVATKKSIIVLDFKSKRPVYGLQPDFQSSSEGTDFPYCISLNWRADGNLLYSGYTDGHIRVWGFE